MLDGNIQRPSYPTVDFVVNAIASWINKYRLTHGMHAELGECSPEDVLRIAADIWFQSSRNCFQYNKNIFFAWTVNGSWPHCYKR